MRRLLATLPVVLILATAGCSASEPFVPTIEGSNFAPSLGVDLATSTRTSSGLYYRDLTVGGGAQVPASGTAAVNTDYEGYLRNGTMFDEGSLPFVVGTNAVIPGFDEGMRGMRVGGTRQLIIPPALGYGSQRVGSIPPNSILVFNVTLTGMP